jgi:tetratricopeptide (TPR) repeat protein
LLVSLSVSIVAQAPQTPNSPAKPAAKQPTKPPTKPAAGARPQISASLAARRQFDAYMLEFRSKPDDASLRQKIIALVRTMTPEPEIPQIAQDSFSQATAQLKTAARPEEFKAAAKLFEQAAAQAPWYADADYFAGTAYVRAGDFDGVRRNLELYQAAVKPGADTEKAQELQRALDRQQFEQQLALAMQKFAADPSDAARSEIIKMVQAAKIQPDVPEEARGHYVTAVALMHAAEDNAGYEQRAIDEYKIALLAAPWWGEAYKRLAAAQSAAGQFAGAGASLNFYLLTQPSDARAIQDEIYSLKVAELKAEDEQTKKQAEDLRKKQLSEQQKNVQSAVNSGAFTFEGIWYDASTPKQYFVGGKDEPDCDYVIKKNGGHWSIANRCPHLKRSIDHIEVQSGQFSFRLTGHDSGFPYSEVDVTFTLSPDGQKMDGRGTYYDKENFAAGYYSVLWVRRHE